MASFLIFVGLLLIGGLAAGIMAGLFGVGGGAILVPVLYEVFGHAGIDESIRTHMSVATSLAVILPTGIRSAMGHQEKGSIDWKFVKLIAPFIVIGVIIGIFIAKEINGEELRLIYAVMVLIVAAYLLWSRQNPDVRLKWPADWVTKLYGVFTGGLSTLMGIGGGTFSSSYMTSFGRSIHQAVGTAAAIGPIIALPAILGYIWAGLGHPSLPQGSIGFISLIGAILILPASLLAAPWGVKLAHTLSRSHLELMFALFLLSVGVRFLWSVII